MAVWQRSVLGHRHLLIGSGNQGSIYLNGPRPHGAPRPKRRRVANPVPFLFQLFGSANAAFNSPACWNSTVHFAGGHTGIVAYPLVHGRLGSRLLGVTCCAHTPSISANGNTNGIVWASDGTDRWAFQATIMNLLIDVQSLSSIRDLGAYFATVTVARGKVYAGMGRKLIVLGLK